MVKKLLFLLVVPFALFGQNLSLVDGVLKAHTEVFGDSTIDPATKKIDTDLSIGDTIESLKGTISINALDLVSDNSDRDEHMYEAIGAQKFTTITFEIKKVIKSKDRYMLGGELTLHGVTKILTLPVSIEKNGVNITLYSKFSIIMSEFGIEPPTLLFLTVRDQVDIDVNLQLKGK